MSRFQKGQGGRPKGSKNKYNKSLTKLLEEKVYQGTVTNSDIKYVEAMWVALDSIIFGKKTPAQVKLNAIRFLFERLEGLPTQVVKQEISNTPQAFNILESTDKQIKTIDLEVIENADAKTD